MHGNRAQRTRFSNAVVRFQKTQRIQKRRRKKQRMNLGADSDQTQPVKASGDVKRLIGRVSPPRRCKNPATQAAKASGNAKRKDRTCLAAATMQKPSNPGADLTKPRRRKLQAMRRFLWRMGLICFGFDLFMGFWGLEEQEKKSVLSVG